MTHKPGSLALNAFMNVINHASGMLFPLITFPYVSRILQPEGLGQVNFARSIISYFLMVASLGIPLYGVRESARRRDDPAALSQLAVELFALNAIMTLVAAAMLTIFLGTSERAAADPWLFWICALPMLMAPLGFNWLFQGVEEFVYITIRTLAFRLLILAAIFICVRDQADYRIYAFITGLNLFGASLVNLLFARRYLTFASVSWRRLDLRGHLKPVMLLFFTSVAYTIYAAMDKTMLGYLSPMDQVGFYSASQRIAWVFVGAVTAIIAILVPRASYDAQHTDAGQQDKNAAVTYAPLSAFSVLSMAGMLLCARPAILLFCGAAYTPSIMMLQVAGMSLLAITFYHFILYQVLYPLGKDRVLCWAIALGAVINAGLNIVLIPRLAGLGASWATLLSQGCICAAVAIYLYRLKPALVKALTRITARHLVMILLAMATGLAVMRWLPGGRQQTAQAILAGSACAAVFLVMIIGTNDPALVVVLSQWRRWRQRAAGAKET